MGLVFEFLSGVVFSLLWVVLGVLFCVGIYSGGGFVGYLLGGFL